MSINAIKSRLGSISDARLDEMPQSARNILTKNVPDLIRVAEAAHRLLTNITLPREQLLDELETALEQL